MFTLVRLLTVLVTFAPSLVAGAPTADPQRPPSADGGPRIRPYDAWSAALLLEGLERSSTIRNLSDRLEELDVIVYIEMRPALPVKLGGTMTWLTAAGPYRYVRISLNPKLIHDAVIATLGHELQHALEVAEAPAIRDAASLESYYRQNGLGTASDVGGLDTEAARIIGVDVRRELAGARVSRVAESIPAFKVEEWHSMYWRARGMLPP